MGEAKAIRTIRLERMADVEAIRAVHDAAFAGAAEGRLVEALRVAELLIASVVADANGVVVGSAVFSQLTVETDKGTLYGAELAPVAVLPGWQGMGIGSEMIGYGMRRCREDSAMAVFVLGDPGYYRRLGFRHDLAQAIESPYSGRPFMALELTPGALDVTHGTAHNPSGFSRVG